MEATNYNNYLKSFSENENINENNQNEIYKANNNSLNPTFK